MATALTEYGRSTPTTTSEINTAGLAAAVARAKRCYQATRYDEAAGHMPQLLHELRTATEQASKDHVALVQRLLAEAYQVTGSLLLKLGDPGLAMLAADRSITAAHASHNPLTMASSARIITHALTRSGQPGRAVAIANDMAQRLKADTALASTKAVAVYGALLLRGASAAAHDEDRDTALCLIGEAAEAAKRSADDTNLCWTAFGPTNVLLHKVTLAVTLGNAGQAIEYARQVQLDRVPLAERRACLFTDVARAFTQWGKHDRAYQALRTAEDIAPQEVRRPSVQHLVAGLTQSAPNTVRPHLRELAERIGARQ